MKLQKIKGKDGIPIPDEVSALILVDTAKEVERILKVLRERPEDSSEVLVIGGNVTVLYRPKVWGRVKG